MLKPRLLPTIFTLIACFGLAAGVVTPQPQDAPSETGLVLEVTKGKGAPPSVISIPGAISAPIKYWPTPVKRTEPPVQAVNVRVLKEDVGVKVLVSVFVGERVSDHEISVASRWLRENEKTSIIELKEHGIEPIELKLIHIAVAPPIIPEWASNAPSVSIEKIEPRQTTFPTYQVTLKNHSDKAIFSVGADLLVDGRKAMLSWPQGKDGQPLIAPGETAEIRISGVKDSDLQIRGLTAATAKQTVLITGAVFDDNSIEGDPEVAAWFRTARFGRKEQIARALPLLHAAYGSAENDLNGSVQRLKEGVLALRTDLDPALLEPLKSELPPGIKTNLQLHAEAGMGNLRIDLLKELNQLLEPDKNHMLDLQSFRQWLLATLEKYERFLAIQ